MSAIAAHYQPSKAAELLQRGIRDLPADGYKQQRLAILSPALTQVSAIEDEKWSTLRGTATANAMRAWTIARDAFAAAGLPGWVSAADDARQGIDSTVARYVAGEGGPLWGWGNPNAVAGAAGDTLEQLGLPNPFDPQNARGGANDETDKWWHVSPMTILKWGAPALLLLGATWYFWPVVAGALRLRRFAASGIDKGLNRVGARDAFALPAPQPLNQIDLHPLTPPDFDVPVVEEFDDPFELPADLAGGPPAATWEGGGAVEDDLVDLTTPAWDAQRPWQSRRS